MTVWESLSVANNKRWRLALFIIFTLPGMAFSTWVTRTPRIREMLDVSIAEMGWVIFGLAVGSFIGLIFSNSFVALKGARFVIVTCGLLFTLGLTVLGFSIMGQSTIAVFCSLMLFGFGYGFAEVALNVEGAAVERAFQQTLMPALHAGFSAGTLLGAGIGFLAEAVNWSILYHFMTISIVIAITVVWFSRYLQPGVGKESLAETDEEPMTLQERLAVWKEKRLLLLGLIVLGMAFAEGSANDWLPIIMVEGFSVHNATASFIYTIFVASMMITRLAGGYFLDRFGRVIVLRAMCVIAVIGLLLLMLSTNIYLAVAGVICWGIGVALGFPVGMSAAGDEHRGAAARVGAIAMIGYISFLVGPPFLGMLGEHFGILRALVVVLIVVILSGLIAGAAKPIGDTAKMIASKKSQ